VPAKNLSSAVNKPAFVIMLFCPLQGLLLVYISHIVQVSPADAKVTRDSAAIPIWPPADIWDIIEPEIAPFDPPTRKTLA